MLSSSPIRLACLAAGLFAFLGCTDSASSVPAPAREPEQHYLGDSPGGATVPPSGATWFVDQTEKSGVRFTVRNGRDGGHFTILESVGCGAALFDLDQDGDLDLLIPGGGTISRAIPPAISGLPIGLFRNHGDGTFTNASELVQWGGDPPYFHGAFVADFDRDGFPDVLLTGYGGCRLLRNNQGQKLVDVTEASKLALTEWTTAAAWGDVDRDGWADLFLVGYVDWNGTVDMSCGDARKQMRDV